MRAQRMAALLILAIPGAMSIYGVKLMRDAIFSTFDVGGFQWSWMIGGFLLFVIGILFIGRFIYVRDKKRKYRPKFKDDLSEEN